MALPVPWVTSSLVLLSLSAGLGGGCKKGSATAGTDGASSAAVAASAPVVESGPRSFVPLIRDCAANAVVFDVGGRAGVMLSRAVDPKKPESALALTYATWDRDTATWTDEPIAGVTADREVHEVTAEGTWDNPRLRVVHGDAAARDVGGHRTFFSVNDEGTVPVLALSKNAGAWSSQPVAWKPGPMPPDDGPMGAMMPDLSSTKARRPTALDREQTKLVAKAPGCVFFPESTMTAPKGWAYGHLGGIKCKKQLAVAMHELGPDRGETFTWPAKKDAPLTIVVRVLGPDTYVALLKPGPPPVGFVVDKLFRIDGGKQVSMPVPPDDVMAALWKHGDELRAGGAAHMWRLRGGSWDAFGPGGCLVTEDTPHIQIGTCGAGRAAHQIVSVVDGTFVDLPATVSGCSPLKGHEASLLQCGGDIVELTDGKPSEPHELPKGDGNDESHVFAGGALWAARGRSGRSAVFRLGSVGKSFTCTESGPLRLTPYVARDGEAPLEYGQSNSP